MLRYIFIIGLTLSGPVYAYGETYCFVTRSGQQLCYSSMYSCLLAASQYGGVCTAQ